MAGSQTGLLLYPGQIKASNRFVEGSHRFDPPREYIQAEISRLRIDAQQSEMQPVHAMLGPDGWNIGVHMNRPHGVSGGVIHLDLKAKI